MFLLVTKRRFISARPNIETIINFEGTVFSIVGAHPKNEIIMTRDYFDFQVEHLSPVTNTLENHKLDAMLIYRLNNRALQFQDRLDHSLLKTQSHTVAIIPFNCKGATSAGDEVKLMRIAMFKVTFWSIYRYNIKIVVSVSSPNELQILLGLDLPIFQIYEIFDVPPADAWQQPRKSLLRASTDIQNEPAWKDFQFVLYTDADQIIHLRSLPMLYQTVDIDNFILAPHRIQV